MRFEMKKPCKDCPFVKGSSTNKSLDPERLEEIIGYTREDKTFPCHKSLDKKEIDWQHCAGSLLFQERDEGPNQMTRIATALGLYNPEQLNKEFEGLIEPDDYPKGP